MDERYTPVNENRWHGVLLKEMKLTAAMQVLEVRPVIDWNKGKAVEFLLDSLRLADSDKVLPIYIGDDRTDEDAFKVRTVLWCRYRKSMPFFMQIWT